MTTYAFKGLVGSNWVTDSTALAALAITDDIVPGSRVMNADVGHNFTYTISTAALDPDVVVAVSGRSDARWILDTSDSEVASVTGTAPITVDNTDPLNPIVTVADGAIALAKLENLADATVNGRALGAGTGVPTALTRTQLTALSNPATSSLPGDMSAIDFAKLSQWPAGIPMFPFVSAEIDLTVTGNTQIIPATPYKMFLLQTSQLWITTVGGTRSVTANVSLGSNSTAFDNFAPATTIPAGILSQAADTKLVAFTTSVSPTPVLDLSTSGLVFKVNTALTGTVPVCKVRFCGIIALYPV